MGLGNGDGDAWYFFRRVVFGESGYLEYLILMEAPGIFIGFYWCFMDLDGDAWYF